jgi:hypothetical protein
MRLRIRHDVRAAKSRAARSARAGLRSGGGAGDGRARKASPTASPQLATDTHTRCHPGTVALPLLPSASVILPPSAPVGRRPHGTGMVCPVTGAAAGAHRRPHLPREVEYIVAKPLPTAIQLAAAGVGVRSPLAGGPRALGGRDAGPS